MATPFVLLLLFLLLAPIAGAAEPVAVRFTEGVTRGFPILKSPAGERLAQGELVQVAQDTRVASRLTFRFTDGSLYDESVVFSQRGVFTLLSYHLVQKGPSFPETIEAWVDRGSEWYSVRYRADEDSPEEHASGHLTLPADVYNGMLVMLMKNLPPRDSTLVQILVFSPRPRLVKVALTPVAEEPVHVGDVALRATRYLIKPQLGKLATFLIIDVPDINVWIANGDAPAFVRFLGPLDFMGPVWRIDVQ
ncbi:MAG: hypothetical protein ACREJG_08030 [Candidatus Rokuibacteriota bacterium]